MAKITNQMILADAYRRGSTSYQQNAPDPSQATMAESIEFLFNPVHSNWLNEFASYLFNVFGTTFTRNRAYESKWNRFKQAWTMGDKALEYNLNFLKPYAYKNDWNAGDVHNLLEVVKPTGESVIHEVNFADTFAVSYNEDDLRRAFDTETGLSDYMASVTRLPMNSDEVMTDARVKQLIAEFEIYHGFYKHQLSALPTDKATGEEFAVAIQTIAGELEFPSATYNALDVKTPTWVPKSDQGRDLVLITTPATLAAMNVYTLANLYHDERAEVPFDILTIDSFSIPNAVALLCAKDWLVMWDQTYRVTNFFNPQTLTTSNYLHHRGAMSASPFMAAILFTTASGTVNPEVTMTAAGISLLGPENEQVVPGRSYELGVELIGTITSDPAGAAEELGLDSVVPASSAVWALSYAPAETDPVDYAIDPLTTYVDRFNVLHVAADFPVGGTLGLICKSTYINPDGVTPNLTATLTLTAISA